MDVQVIFKLLKQSECYMIGIASVSRNLVTLCYFIYLIHRTASKLMLVRKAFYLRQNFVFQIV